MDLKQAARILRKWGFRFVRIDYTGKRRLFTMYGRGSHGKFTAEQLIEVAEAIAFKVQ